MHHAPSPSAARGLAAALVAIAALAMVGWSLYVLEAGRAGVRIERAVLANGLPVTVFAPQAAGPADRRPAVVLAHGFAGSQPLMRPGALTLARAGMIAVTFDFPGHGRHPRPLPGSLREHDALLGALLGALDQTAAYARALPEADGRLAVLGHSMASDLVLRHALAHPGTVATVGLSLVYGGAPTRAPANLLAIYGSLEPDSLQGFARRLIAGDGDPEAVRAGTTYGRFVDGSARRLVLAEGAEHIGVLYAEPALREARDWLTAAFAAQPTAPPDPAAALPGTPVDDASARGLSGASSPAVLSPAASGAALPSYGLPLLTLLAGVVLLGWPLSVAVQAALGARARRRFFDRHAPAAFMPGDRARRARRQWWWAATVPAVVTPLLLAVVPSGFVPVLVADHLLLHFLVYGLLTLAGLCAMVRAGQLPRPAFAPPSGPAVLAAIVLVGYAMLAPGLAIDRYAFNLAPADGRGLLIVAMSVATLAWFLSEAWLATASSAPRAAGVITRTAFLASLALSVALDFRGLFFLLIILPAVLALFLVQGLLARWSLRATGRPWIGALGGAFAFAWAIAVTFPAVRA